MAAENSRLVCVNAIQKVCREYVGKKKFRLVVAKIVKLQALVRRNIAQKCFVNLLEERWQIESNAAVMIQASWRCHVEKTDYRLTLADIVLVQRIVRKLVLRQKASITSSNVRKMIGTKKIEPFTVCPLKKSAATKIQTKFRGRSCRLKWLDMVGNIIKCQSIIRRWRTIIRTEELLLQRKLGPQDIFLYIRTRQAATAKIQHIYQNYTKRSLESKYQDYVIRLNQTKSAEEETAKKVPFCQHIEQESDAKNCDLDADECDLLLVEESIEKEPFKEAIETEPFAVKDEKIIYANEEDEKLESQCFDGSRCGLSVGVHEALMATGKFLYECIGDPSDETAEDLLTVMELGEEAAFCCWKKKPTQLAAEAYMAQSIDNGVVEKNVAAVPIQSKYRSSASEAIFNEDDTSTTDLSESESSLGMITEI